MGTLLSNIHLQTEADVAEAVSGRIKGRAWIAPVLNGWTSVFDETSERADAKVTEGLAGAWSEALQVPVLAFTLRDDDSFTCVLFEQGRRVEKLEVTERPDATVQPPVPTALLRYCQAGTDAETVSRLLYGPPPATAARQVPDQVRQMLDASSQLFRSLPPEVVDQLMERVQKEIPDDHPMMQAFKTNRQGLLDLMAERSASLQAETDSLAHQAQTSMEPTMRLLGPTATIPTRLDGLATLLGLVQRVCLSWSMIDEPEEEGWRQVVGR